MEADEFLRRLQPLKAGMETAYFRVYQPFHVREEDFDALLALLDEQAQKRTLNLQRTNRPMPWIKQAPAGMRLIYSDVQTPAQVHARAQELKELGVGWVLFGDVPFPHTESLRQTLRQRIDLWHEEGLAVGLDFDVASTPAEDPWALQAIRGDSVMQQRYWMISDPKLAALFSPFSKEKENGDFLRLDEIGQYVYRHPQTGGWLLDYKNPQVLAGMLERFCELVSFGADVIELKQLDSMWKECKAQRLYPQVPDLFALFAAAGKLVCPDVLVMGHSEAGAKDLQILSQRTPAGTAIVDQGLMINGWNSLATRDTKMLQGDLVFHALNSSAIAVHPVGEDQGVVWNFNEEAARMRGWDPDCHRQFLMDFYTGQALGSFAEGESDRESGRCYGTLASWAGCGRALDGHEPYELENSCRRILLLLGLNLALRGMPLLQDGDELGALNDASFRLDPEKEGDRRWLQRPVYVEDKARRRYQPLTVEYRIFQSLKAMLQVRAADPDWNEGREQIGNVGNDAVLAFVRAAEQRRLLFLFNFTESPQYCALTSLFNKEEQARELLTGRRIRGSQESLDLKAYEFLWLIVEA